MNKADVYAFLKERKIPYEAVEHKAVYNMAEMTVIHLPHTEAEAKNLFLRDDKKQNYYLLTVKGDKHVDLKKFQKENGTRRLSFASDEDLLEFLDLFPGAVTPLGILNDETRIVKLYLDEDFRDHDGLIAVHPNDNTATVWLNVDDLIKIIREHGSEIRMVQFK